MVVPSSDVMICTAYANLLHTCCGYSRGQRLARPLSRSATLPTHQASTKRSVRINMVVIPVRTGRASHRSSGVTPGVRCTKPRCLHLPAEGCCITLCDMIVTIARLQRYHSNDANPFAYDDHGTLAAALPYMTLSNAGLVQGTTSFRRFLAFPCAKHEC